MDTYSGPAQLLYKAEYLYLYSHYWGRSHNYALGKGAKLLKVAIVDDEPDLQRLYKLALASRGYDIVFVANDGTDAVEKNRLSPAQIIIMDHRMPTKNGIEATRDILGEFPKTGVIFVSADEAVEKEARESGAKRFLKKPISLKDLINNIEEVAKELGIQAVLTD